MGKKAEIKLLQERRELRVDECRNREEEQQQQQQQHVSWGSKRAAWK